MSELLDIVIIGGGFSGVGLAYEAALNGFNVRLIESGELGGGTSASSLRIVHGGFRYLQNAAVKRVLESARAKKFLLEKYPDLVTPLSCVMPLSKFGAKSRVPVSVALSVYNLLTQQPQKQRGRVISAEDVKAKLPLLADAASNGALQWWDAVVNDPRRLIRRVADDAIGFGAEISEHARVVAVELLRHHAITKISTVSGEIELRSKIVVNAAGRSGANLMPEGVARPARKYCRGFNLVLNKILQHEFAVAGQGRGRMLFVVPRGEVSAVGTWYSPIGSEMDSTQVSEIEIVEAIADLNAAFPEVDLKRTEVAAIEQGFLPVKAGHDFEGAKSLSNENIFYAGRYSEVLGTKFTTFITQATKFLQHAAPLLAD